MRRLPWILAVLPMACGGDSAEEKKKKAAAGCRGRYDNIQRWISANNRSPSSDEEYEAAANNKAKDPWGNAYEIEVENGRVVVWSHGPDGQPETSDDISYPPTD